MNLIILLHNRISAVVLAVAILVGDFQSTVVEGATSTDGGNSKIMMSAVKLMRRPQSRLPSAFVIHPLHKRVFGRSHDTIEKTCISCAQQRYIRNFPITYGSISSTVIRMSSVSTEEDAQLLTKDDQSIYDELSSLSQKIRSLDESYYGGGTNIISDEEYDALARREAELCTKYPHLLLRLEERSGLGKEATRFGGRVGQSYKEMSDEEDTQDAKQAKKKKKKTSTKTTTKKRKKRKHLENAPMQSLDNAMDAEEVVLWINRVKKLLTSTSTADIDLEDDEVEKSIPITIVAEPKIDGLSLSLRYELDAKQSDATISVYTFVWGATRGDGRQGEEVTEAVKSAWMKNVSSNPNSSSEKQQFHVPKQFRISACEYPPPETIEVRGEVVLPQASFDEFTQNIIASENNKNVTFSNARNAASGILLRSKEPTSEEALEQTRWLQSRLTFYAYDIVASNANNNGSFSSDWLSTEFTETSEKMRDSLSTIGFQVPNPVAVEEIILDADTDKTEADIPSLLDYHRKMLNDRDGAVSLPYQIDGVVYKVSSLSERRICGSSSRTPRWAIAHKFPPLCAVTKLNGIEIQVGRTGAMTPVAILEPVDLGGVQVARASLHNFHYARKILLPSSNTTLADPEEQVVNKGVEVLVSRAGDVIPQVMKRLFDNDGYSTDGVISLEPPQHCPACGSPTSFGSIGTTSSKKSEKTEDAIVGEDASSNDAALGGVETESGQVLRCSGPQLLCQPRAINAMSYAYSRAALDVKGLSKSKLQHLMDENIIRYPADLFIAFGSSNKDDPSVGEEILSKIADLPGWGEISSQNVADSIRAVSDEGVSLSRYIYSLGIPFIGTHVSELVANLYGNVDNFLDAIEYAATYDYDETSSDEDEENVPFGALSEVKGIGPAALSSLISFSKEEVLVKAAKDLAAALKVHEGNQSTVVNATEQNGHDSSIFEGMTVVFTGALPGMSRTAAQSLVKQLGAKATPNSVSKSTTLVVEGEKGGKKAKQARDLDIRVITAEEFVAMIPKT